MGYYVRIEETASNFKIKKENFERGYQNRRKTPGFNYGDIRR